MWRVRSFSVAVPKIFILETGAQNPENHKHRTIKISMATMNLKSLPDFLILWFGTNLIDDLEFILLYDYSQSR